ncbi:putative murein peptide carboxypeptidase [Streptomyces sp. ADI96-02]|uniref:S66 peptidase family protein n=1 Tax=unclassified Streptomyces TaxID=2593676 RepID=UPI000F553E01|nr:LD-carboxypeptidase [Streptomyces sp. ADI96-02]RPK55670.1 putative murein peptide carboxypeptidase [Streptomyces sp. ADI96-02]
MTHRDRGRAGGRPVRPPRLRPGARVAVVAPSGPVPAGRLAAGVAVLRAWGLDPVVAPHARDTHPELDHLAGADADRAADLQAAWCDPSVDAVICARGGYGAHRVVDLLDWSAIRAAGPKAFVGYSDATVLHEAFALRAGYATLHGPMPATESFLADPATREHLRATLFAPETVRTLASDSAAALVPGRARGILFGGCLSLLAADAGTPHARTHARGGLLVIEDVGEAPYRIDGALTRLLRSGALDGPAGVVCGSWQDCGPYARVRAVLADRFGPLGIPVVEELGFGHGPGPLTIPLGVPAVLDAPADGGRCTLTVEEPALR